MPNVLIDNEIDPRVYRQQGNQSSQSPPQSNVVTPAGAAETQQPDVVIIYSTPSPSPFESRDTLSTLEREDSLRELKRPRVGNFTTTSAHGEFGLKAPEISVVEPRENVLSSCGTITNDQTGRTWRPPYYDPETGIAYDYPGIFLSGMTLGLDKVDTRRMTPGGKVAYYAGRAAGALGLGYGLGVVTGSLIGSSSSATAVAESLAKFEASHPLVASAARGTMKGLLIGSEAAKGIKMKTEGYGWSDVAGTIISDFAGFYAFEKGVASAFNSVRKAKVRKNFADKKSRLFIGEAEQEFIWQDEKGTHVIRAKKPTIVENWPGSLNTKPKPRTVGFKLSKSMERMIHAPGSSKPAPDLPDELRFLQNEPKLPEPLFSEKSIVVKGFTETGKGGKAAGGLLLEEPITLEKFGTSSARASEVARVGNLKREFASMMKNIEKAGKALASASAVGGAVAGTAKVANVARVKPSPGSRSITKPRVLFKTGVGDVASEFNMPKVVKVTKGSHGSVTSTASGTETLFKHWTGVGDVYAEFELTKPKYAPRPVQTPKETPTTKDDEFTIRGLVPVEIPALDETEKQVEKSLKRMNFILTPPELPKKPPKFPSGRGGLAWFSRGGGAHGSWENWAHASWQKRYGSDLFKFKGDPLKRALSNMERSLKKLEKSLSF